MRTSASTLAASNSPRFSSVSTCTATSGAPKSSARTRPSASASLEPALGSTPTHTGPTESLARDIRRRYYSVIRASIQFMGKRCVGLSCPAPGSRIGCGIKMRYRETEHLRVLIANERKDRLALVAPIVVALGHIPEGTPRHRRRARLRIAAQSFARRESQADRPRHRRRRRPPPAPRSQVTPLEVTVVGSAWHEPIGSGRVALLYRGAVRVVAPRARASEVRS